MPEQARIGGNSMLLSAPRWAASIADRGQAAEESRQATSARPRSMVSGQLRALVDLLSFRGTQVN